MDSANISKYASGCPREFEEIDGRFEIEAPGGGGLWARPDDFIDPEWDVFHY
jgi:hypothetical protein